MGHSIHLVVDVLPGEFWNPLVVSELGLEGDVLEVVVEVPVRVSDLEVVALSGHVRNSAPLVLVLPAWKLKPSLGCLSAEEENKLVLSIFLPGHPESTGSWVTFEVTSVNVDVLTDWMHGESLVVVHKFELPVRVMDLEGAPSVFFIGDVDLLNPWEVVEEHVPILLMRELFDVLGAFSFSIVLDLFLRKMCHEECCWNLVAICTRVTHISGNVTSVSTWAACSLIWAADGIIIWANTARAVCVLKIIRNLLEDLFSRYKSEKS